MLPDPMAFTSDQLCDADFYQRIVLVKAVVSWCLWRSKNAMWIHRNPHMIPLLQVKYLASMHQLLLILQE